MSIKLKVIKSKQFDIAGVQHTHYTAAYKGRVFGVSTLRFQNEEPDTLTVAEGILTIKGEIEPIKHTSTDPLTGEVKSFIDIVPKLGMVLAEF